MNKRYWIFLVFIAVILPFNAQSLTAQDSLICAQNESYWEDWQANADLRNRMTGSIWNATSFDISPDGKLLVVGNSSSLILYDAQTLTPTVALESTSVAQGGSYNAVDWSPDGKYIAATHFVAASPAAPNAVSGIEIWDVSQEQEVTLLAGRPSAIAWSPDSAVVAEADVSGNVWLWDIATGKSSSLYERKMGIPVMRILAWSPDGHYLATSPNIGGPMRLYKFGEAEPLMLESPEKDIDYLVWSPSGDQLVMGNQLAWNLFFFDVSTGDITRTLNGADGNPLDLQWSPDGAWMARGTQLGLFLWDMNSDATTPVRSFDEHMPPFVRMIWTPDSQSLISVDFEGSLYRWNVETGCVEAAFLKEWKPG
jgi:WD40 repeat protein